MALAQYVDLLSLGQPSLPGLPLHPDFNPQLQTITMPHKKKCGQSNEGCKQRGEGDDCREEWRNGRKGGGGETGWVRGGE